MIKLDQIGFPHQFINFPMKRCHIYRKDKNDCFIFDFFWIRSVQNGSDLIKLDQIGFLKNQKMLLRHVSRSENLGGRVVRGGAKNLGGGAQ
jgi:hypothetical protein